MRSLHRQARSVAAAALAVAAVLLVVPSARADAPPFSDPSTTGSLGFCDESGNPVASGSVNDRPFVWTAVSTIAAPNGYGPPRGKASLFAYQPRENVDPGEWTGSQLTAGSVFTSADHPMAQATKLDPSMGDIVSAFPANWDGYFQLRLLFGAPNKQQITSSYPAAVIKISGSQWALVSGGGAPCNAGKAVSAETLFLPSSTFSATPGTSPNPASSGTSPAVGSTGGASKVSGASKVGGASTASGPNGSSAGTASAGHGAGSSTASTSPGSVKGASGASAPRQGSEPSAGADKNDAIANHTKTALAANSRSKSSKSTTVLVVGSVVALIILGGTAAWWARRRQAS